MPATDEDIVRDLLHRYTDQVRPAGTIATAVAARQRHRERRRVVCLAAAGAALGVAAGVIAVVPGHSPPTRPAASARPAAHPSTAGSRLVSLAAVVKAREGALPGNASLVIRTQTDGSIPPQVSYNLYADNGAFYGGGDKKSLMEAIARHENMADGIDAREVAAARYAQAGDLTTAVRRMINAAPNDLGLGLSRAAREKIWKKAMAAARPIYRAKGIKEPPNPPAGKKLQGLADNYLWNNSIDALSAGAGNPQVRAGVLRLLATIPGVTVVNSVTGGQSTLTLTAGSTVFGAGARQVLIINAQTAMPVSSVMRQQGLSSSRDTYRVSRVTLSGVEAGRF